MVSALALGMPMASLRRLLEQVSPQLASDAVLVRQQLDDFAERERNLVQLVESTREFSGLDAVDSVLRAIVSRSRRLLMADVAYFLKFDQESGVSQMIVSEGILSDDFAQLVVPRDEGISGFIAASRKPSWTPDYLNDARYSHNNSIDTATTDEGLRAILGVPVLRNGKVVGLLLAADRRVHDYRPQDVELLFSLAQYAGVAIENATVHEAGRQTVEDLHDALVSLESSENATRSIMDFQDRLLGVLMTNGSIKDLAVLVQAAIGGSVIIKDGGGRLLGQAGRVVLLDPSDDTWRIEKLGEAGEQLGLLAHLPEDEGQGRVPEPEQRQILGRASAVAALLIAKFQAELTTTRARNAAMIRGWLEDPAGAAEGQPDSENDVGHLNAVLLMRAEDTSRQQSLLRIALQRAERVAGLACEYRGSVLLWIPVVDPSESARRYAATMALAVGGKVTVGAAVVSGPLVLATAATTAHHTVRALVALGRSGTGSISDDVAPFPAILANSTPSELADFVQSALGTLLEYDRRHNTELMLTLRHIYTNSSNASSAAETLLVHVNTVHQRLARIDQITSESWRDSDVALRRQLALKVLDLSSQPAEPASLVEGKAS